MTNILYRASIAERLRPALCLLVLLLLASGTGCDSREAQEDFLDDAAERPEGITRTGSDGEVVSVDEDDWRTAPTYAALIQISPAHPNPSLGRLVTIDVSVLHAGAVQGALVLRAFDDRGNLTILDELPQSRQPGFYAFRFPSSVLGTTGVVRVFIYDRYSAGSALVSYGDIQL